MDIDRKSSDVIVLRNVTKVYSVEAQAVEALKRIDLTIKSNQNIAVIGKSGAGKSSLLHIIGTLDRPTQGKVWLNGTEISTLSDYASSLFRNSTLGFVFQMKNLFLYNQIQFS